MACAGGYDAINANGMVYHYSTDDTLTGPNLVGYASTASGIRPLTPPAQAVLLPNYPNPFNPTTAPTNWAAPRRAACTSFDCTPAGR